MALSSSAVRPFWTVNLRLQPSFVRSFDRQFAPYVPRAGAGRHTEATKCETTAARRSFVRGERPQTSGHNLRQIASATSWGCSVSLRRQKRKPRRSISPLSASLSVCVSVVCIRQSRSDFPVTSTLSIKTRSSASQSIFNLSRR